MKILQEGEPEKRAKKLSCACTNCGCLFEADLKETAMMYAVVTKKFSMRSVQCPWCGMTVTMKVE